MSLKIGFYKSVQGSFSQEVIGSIKQKITDSINCDLIEVDFREGVLINGKVYVGDLCLNDLDIYFWHDTIKPSIWGADNYFTHLLNALESDVKIINSGYSTNITNDKLKAHQTLKDHGLPVGDFALVRSSDPTAIKRVFAEFGNDVLLKPRFGGWGIGIIRCKNEDELMSTIEFATSISFKEEQFLIEKFHDNDLSKWVSVVVIGGQIIMGYRKPLLTENVDWKIYDPNKKDGKGNMSEYVNPSPELADLAIKAQKAIGKDIIGFDFIYTKDSTYKIIDENGRPGLYEHCLEAAGINISEVIAKLIIDTANS